MAKQDYDGRVIWIVGASAGIGAALARELDGRGARLILSARDKAGMEQVAASCRIHPRILPLDLDDPATIEAAARELGDIQLDAVICVAALYDPGRVDELDAGRAASLVRVNLLGSFHLARIARPHLREGGQLVLFGSVAGYFGLPRGQVYSATKAAIINLAETLRSEWAPGVDVRLVSPGFVRTRLTEKNDFEMPALMEANDAAQAVADGLLGRAFEIHFPKRLTVFMKVLRLLPYALSLRLVARLR